MISPFDDYDVMAGQGTLGVELAEQAGELDLVLVPIGGGGLAAGVGTAVKALLPGAAVIGVEPAGADDTSRSLRAGHRVTLDAADTIADGLRASHPGELTFPINRRLLDDVVDRRARPRSSRPCGSASPGSRWWSSPAARCRWPPCSPARCGEGRRSGRRRFVLSGGNIDPADFAFLQAGRG